jgi:hypothetical protein
MKKIEVVFSDDGKVTYETGDCLLSEILFATKSLEMQVLSKMQGTKDDSKQKLQTLIQCLKTLVLPYSEKTEVYFDCESALKTLPMAINYLIKDIEV